jgi:hypothetical protein
MVVVTMCLKRRWTPADATPARHWLALLPLRLPSGGAILLPAALGSKVNALLQLRVLRFGLLQDGDVGIGVFPEGEEIFVGGERTNTSSIGIRSL